MVAARPLLFIASVSVYEAEHLERALQPSGWSLLRVERAEQAAQLFQRFRKRGPVLVIDAGVLEMPHDGQWRELRALYPELATIVRCLLPKKEARGRRDDGTLEVDPDDIRGIRAAVRGFCVPFSPRGLSPPALQESRP